MKRRGWIGAVAVVFAMLVGLGASSPAGATVNQQAPMRMAGYPGNWKVLIPLRVDLRHSGLQITGVLKVKVPGATTTRRFAVRPHAGATRLGDRRTAFTYRVAIPLSDRIGKLTSRHPERTRITATFRYDDPLVGVNGHRTGTTRAQTRFPRANVGTCETLPRVIIGARIRGPRLIGTPACGRKLNWRIGESPDRGKAEMDGGRVAYTPNAGQLGSDELTIEGYFKGDLASRQKVQIRVGNGNPNDTSVIAMGDSVTAGFGYFGATGKPMGITQLYDCKPGATVLNDACSSNSYNRNSSVGAKPNYLPDFGLSRNISWAAQWANEYGITDFENYAVTGSAPTDWLPGGQINQTLSTIQAANPDYILMTLGANPLLSDVLFGVDNMKCALESDLFGDFRQCVLAAFEAVDLDGRMNQVFTSLVQNTTSRIVVMEYPLSVPSSAIAYSATQLEMMGELLNQVIGAEAAAVSSSRITQITPPRFNVGIEMEPMYPSNYSCSFLGYEVDGPSVQSTPTQDELLVDHPLSFCSGPAIGQPWVISGDTGIHPSTAGYSQMASAIPAPGS